LSAAAREAQPFSQGGEAERSAIALDERGEVGFGLMRAFATSDDQPDLRPQRAAERGRARLSIARSLCHIRQPGMERSDRGRADRAVAIAAPGDRGQSALAIVAADEALAGE